KEKLRKADIHFTYEAVHAYAEKLNEQAKYYYAVYKQGKKEQKEKDPNKVLVIGSGPIKIGQGIEFDYCSVQGVKALQKLGKKPVLINNNPATVSTDYEVADRLYFEPITTEDVLKVMEYEQIDQVIIQFGGQTAINLVAELEEMGVQFFGSSQRTINTLEDRESFYAYLQSIGVPHIPGEIAYYESDLKEKINKQGYPVLVRPSYVIGGQGMVILKNETSLHTYLKTVDPERAYPILIDAYYPGKEVEIDAVTDGDNVFIPAIFEHIEKAGLHSGDSMAVTPPISLSEDIKEEIISYTRKIARNIPFKGVFNIQFVIYQDQLYVLEVNPRASRTVPVTSKVTGANLIEMAVSALLGKKMTQQEAVFKENSLYTRKSPVCSTNKLPGVDPIVVPEMKSTGELIGLAKQFDDSIKKAFLWDETLESHFLTRKKQLYMASPIKDDEQLQLLKNNCERIGIQLIDEDDFSQEVTKDSIEAWMRTEEAFAIYDHHENDSLRKAALALNIHVMSSLDTVHLLSQLNVQANDVQPIQQLEKAYQKEVVYT